MTAALCATCGTPVLRENAKFCDECGSPITLARQIAEYKQVTVLFADVVKSMDIASALDPERLRDIMSYVFNCSAAVVQRSGGTVDKFIGDGTMALFGGTLRLASYVQGTRAYRP